MKKFYLVWRMGIEPYHIFVYNEEDERGSENKWTT